MSSKPMYEDHNTQLIIAINNFYKNLPTMRADEKNSAIANINRIINMYEIISLKNGSFVDNT